MTDDDEITEVQTQVVGIIEKLDEDDKIKIKKEEKEEDNEGEFGGQQIVTALALLDMENEVLQETSGQDGEQLTRLFIEDDVFMEYVYVKVLNRIYSQTTKKLKHRSMLLGGGESVFTIS